MIISSLRNRLLLFGLAAVLPLLLLCAALLVGYVRQLVQVRIEEIQRDTEAVANIFDTELRAGKRLVSTIAAMAQGLSAAQLHEVARGQLLPHGANLVIHDESGRQILNALVPLGSDVKQSFDTPMLNEILRQDRVIVSDVLRDVRTGDWLVAISAPVTLNDGQRGVANLTLRSTYLAQLIGRGMLYPGRWALLDSTGSFIARSDELERFVGRELPENMLGPTRAARHGSHWITGVESDHLLRSWVWLSEADWFVAMGVPSRIIMLPVYQMTVLSGLGLVAALVTIAFLAAGMTNGIVRPVRQLIADAVAKDKGEAAARLDRVEEQPIGEFAQLREILKDYTARQELIAREYDHRSRNIVSLAISLARRTLADNNVPAEVSTSLEGRLRALGEANGLLAKARWSGVGLSSLISSAAGALAERVRMDGAPVILPPQQAESFALVLHELFTNAVKHGALSVPQGGVDVRWTKEGGTIAFSWVERGGPRVEEPSRKSFGTTLLTSALGSKATTAIEYRADGLRYSATVPLPA